MNREDIIHMAREADKFANKSAAPSGSEWWQLERDTHLAALVAAAERAEMAKHCAEITRAAVTKAVDGAIALEREACAKLAANTVCDTHIPTGIKIYGTRVANTIRARSNT